MQTPEQKIAHKKYYNNHPESRLLDSVRKRAKRKGMECTLTKEDIVVPDKCPVFDEEFVHNQGRQMPFSPSVDRLDNTKGYVPDNIIVVSVKANMLKRDATLQEMKMMVDFYEKIM